MESPSNTNPLDEKTMDALFEELTSVNRPPEAPTKTQSSCQAACTDQSSCDTQYENCNQDTLSFLLSTIGSKNNSCIRKRKRAEQMKQLKEARIEEQVGKKCPPVFQLITIYCDVLLPESHQYHYLKSNLIRVAQETCKQYSFSCLRGEKKKTSPSVRRLNKPLQKALAVACICISARDHGCPFTVTELSTTFKVPRSKLCKIVFSLNDSTCWNRRLPLPNDFVPRFVAELNLPGVIIQKANILCTEWCNRSIEIPKSALLAMTAILVVCRFIGNGVLEMSNGEIAKKFCFAKCSLEMTISEMLWFVDNQLKEDKRVFEDFMRFL